jgi:CBS domain-containing protein
MPRTVEQLLAHKGTDVWSVSPDATVFDALRIMADKRVGALVVLEGDRVAGIISERDYARKVILLDRGSKETAVSEIMTVDLYTVTRAETVPDCMTLMTEHRIRHLPVVEEGSLVGVISIGDVVKALIQDQAYLIEQLESYITS